MAGAGLTPPGICRDCGAVLAAAPSCPNCRSSRIVRHPQILELGIAHIDCDAFYASVEKRDRPELAARPVVVGGGSRGVVTAACYVARMYGIRSAMPMFKALKACPDLVVIKPDFAKYVAASRQIRALMAELTPLVQPLSIDEAVLDLRGTTELHQAPPAAMLARLARRVEAEIGVTISVGLARNRLMSKIAAGRDKPRGFCVIGDEAAAILAPESVRRLPGIGPALEKRLAALGIATLGQLQTLSEAEARRLLGEDGPSLCERARGIDHRAVDPRRETKSISAETTFEQDRATQAELEARLWPLCEKLARRLREAGFATQGVVLKLKTAHFASRTRQQRLPTPSVLPDRLFDAARALLQKEVDGTMFRLIGIGAAGLVPLDQADPPDLADPGTAQKVAAQQAIDQLRARFGPGAIGKGRGLPRSA